MSVGLPLNRIKSPNAAGDAFVRFDTVERPTGMVTSKCRKTEINPITG